MIFQWKFASLNKQKYFEIYFEILEISIKDLVKSCSLERFIKEKLSWRSFFSSGVARFHEAAAYSARRDGPTSGIKLPSCMENLEVALIRKLVASTRLYLMDRSDAKMKWDSLQAGKVYNLLANLSSIDILFHPRFVKFESRYEMQIRNLSSREISN